MLADLAVDGLGELQHCDGKIAIAEVIVRQLKQSASLPISISTPLWVSGQAIVGGPLGDWIAGMAGKTKAPTLGQIRDALRAHSFEVAEAAGALRVAKHGCAAVLVASGAVGQELGTSTGTDTAVAYKERPGAVVAGEISRLLDRGYQKFLKTSKYELPATAQQLQAIHQFTEELTQVTGGVSLYNESLGTTSDLYQYDRVKGREALQPAPARPWELGGGH
ncbi:hypothetical protein [Acidicapsa acidisoli]|uniref:hypothetical protein n=1 Tax=Acidicapsa acidisoli TaxID=1615681 RepID=UPI0021E0D8E6|nr:hypothetical protein [Acidicapsa acidisoli]